MEHITPINVIGVAGVEIHSIGDGSCLLHSVLRGFNRKYIMGSLLVRSHITRKVRNALADVLTETIDGKNVYESLGKGEIAILGQTVSSLSLTGLQKHLRSTEALGQESLELISRFLQIDLLIYDIGTNRPYPFGTPDPYLTGRRAVVIIYRPGHYNLFGLITTIGNIKTLIESDASLIVKWCTYN